MSIDEQAVDLNTDTANEEENQEIHTDDKQETARANGIPLPVAPHHPVRT